MVAIPERWLFITSVFHETGGCVFNLGGLVTGIIQTTHKGGDDRRLCW